MPERNTPEGDELTDLRECYEIVLKMARRAVRDLGHAIDELPQPIRDLWRQRCRHYELVLGGTTEYRIGLHNEIESLEYRIAFLEKQHPPGDKPF